MKGVLFIFVVLLLVTFSGCNSLDDNQKQLADISGKAQADRQVEANNQDLTSKSKAMESDLQIRQRFYQGVSGSYEGAITKREGASQNLNTRLILSATVPVYHSERTRALEEVIADLNGLHLNVQVVQWDAETGATFGCIFTNIQPDLNSGEIRLIAPDCPNSFSLWLASTGVNNGSARSAISSGGASSVAQDLLTDRTNQAGTIAVEMDPTHTPDVLHFVVNRVNP